MCKSLVPVDAVDHQNDKIECSKKAAAASSPSSSKKDKKTSVASVSTTAAAITTTVPVVVPSNIAKLALVGRLCRIVHDTGTAAGSRPPTGELDAFLKTIAGVMVKKGQKLVRADVRDLVMVVVYHWIRQCQACWRDNYNSRSVGTTLLINHDAVEECQDRQLRSNGESLESLYLYYPFVNQTVEEMAAVASTNVTGHSLLQQEQIKDRIEFAAAAFVLQAQREALRRCPMDVTLTCFAVSKLVACLSSCGNNSNNNNSVNPTADSVPSMVAAASAVSTTSSTEVVASLRSRQHAATATKISPGPLPVPTLPCKKPAATRKRKATASVASLAHCSFAGVYDQPKIDGKGEFTMDDKLHLFLRSMQEDDDNGYDTAHQAKQTSVASSSQLASHLIWILEMCYDTREPVSDSKKRKASIAATTRSSKRRKPAGHSTRSINDPNDDENNSDNQGSRTVVPERRYR